MIVLLCVSLMLPVGLSVAQSEKEVEEVKQDDSKPVADGGKKKEAKADAKSKKDELEVFIPSEDISEDLSVSFPVDI